MAGLLLFILVGLMGFLFVRSGGLVAGFLVMEHTGDGICCSVQYAPVLLARTQNPTVIRTTARCKQCPIGLWCVCVCVCACT